MKSGSCPKCGFSNIIKDLLVFNEDYKNLIIEVEKSTDNKKWIQIVRDEESTFHAYVCGNCGYSEFYADNYSGLLSAVKSLGNEKG